MTDAKFHEEEMMLHFEAGRFSEARWHCRIWTYMTAKRVFNDGTEASGQGNPVHAGTPSPNNGLDGRTGL